jgi:PAS domain S-box-containing protein
MSSSDSVDIDYLDVAGISTWHLDPETGRIHVNQRFKKLLNLSDNISSISLAEFASYFSGEDQFNVDKSIRSNHQFQLQAYVISPINRWIVMSGGPAELENSTSTTMAGICTPISPPGDTEKRINQIQELLNRSNDIARIGWWELDLESKKTYWSKVTKEIHEVASDFEPDLEKGIEFYPEGVHRESIQNLVQRAIGQGEPFNHELQILTATGKLKWVRAIGIPIVEDNECTRLYGLFQDIDEQKKALSRIKQQVALFQNTFEYASIGMALVGLKGEWLEVNKSICKMVGYSEKELRSLTFQDITHPDDLEADLGLLNQLVEGKIDRYEMEKRYFHKEGHLVWVLLSVSMVRDEQGNPVHFISQISDITQRKKVEHEREALLDLTQKQNERLLNFAHIVSHNLRSHTGNLSMLFEIMEVEEIAFTKHEYFTMLRDATSQLDGTINQLNNAITFHSEQADDLEEVDIYASIERCMDQLNAYIQSAGATIRNNVVPGTIVKGLKAYLDSVFNNLLTNAIKYRSEERELMIEINAKYEHESLIVELSDNGIGIDLEHYREKVFGLFQTLHHSRKDAKGVGLFLTKNQMEAMGGSIDIESSVGVGTKFILKFP